MKHLLFSLVVLSFVACAGKQDLASVEANAARSAVASPSPSPTLLTSQVVLDAFKNAQIPIKDVIVYDEATDPNHLLGRPNQYVGKINFTDERAEGKRQQGCTIEVFSSDEALTARKNYTEGISNAGGMFLQYIYAHKNVLVRLNHEILPKDAAQYEAALKSL